MKTYSTAFHRYLSAAKSLEMPWYAPVLGKLLQMGETVLITPTDAEEKGTKKTTEDRIIKNVPKPYQTRAKN